MTANPKKMLKGGRKGRPKPGINPISRADEILLLVILVLGENAFSTTILDELRVRAGKKLTVGSLWVSLDGLSKRGAIAKVPVEREGNSGGRPRIFYRLTPAGIEQLRHVQLFQKKLWNDVPDLSEYED